MKNHKLIGLTLAAAVALGSSSCKKDDFLNINTDPNNPLTVSPSVLLTSTIVTTGFAQTNELDRVTSLLVQHVAGIANQPAAYDVYNLRGALDNSWNFELYAGCLQNSQSLIKLAGEKNSPAYAGIAKILKAYNMAYVTDLYGDVPYSQALQGLDNLRPRYDKQEDIYKGNAALGIQGIIDLTKEGMADLDKPSTLNPSSTDDPIYGLPATPATNTRIELDKWKRAGNSLLLKLAITISRREPALAASIINEAIKVNTATGAVGPISTNADDLQVPFGSATGNQNPLYSYNNVNRPDDQMLSQRLLDSMAFHKDPRLPLFFTTTQTKTTTVNTTATVTAVGTFTGYDNGNTAPVPARANRSRYNTYVRGASGEAPARLLTNFQRNFILAEAALMLPGVTLPNSAQKYYQDGITASMLKAGVPQATIDAYFIANPGVVTLSNDPAKKANDLRKIIRQKWYAWMGNGYDPYNDYRRTGFPSLALVLNPGGDSNTYPVRLPYPTSEVTANVGAEGLDPGIKTNTPVWWDI